LPSTPDEHSGNNEPNYSFFEDSANSPSPGTPGLGRSATVVRRDGPGTAGTESTSAIPELPSHTSPSPQWTSYFAPSSSSLEQKVVPRADTALMNHAPPKTSSDSGQHTALDRWSQRRLQRLNTEQGFREQRQGGLASPPASDSSSFTGAPVGYPHQNAQPQPQAPLHQQPQPHHQAAYQASRSNASPALHSQPVSSSRSSTYPVHEQPQMAHMQSQHPYSPQDPSAQFQENNRPQVQQSRSYSQHSALEEQQAMASANNGSMAAPKATRPASNNRQSVQNNGLAQREAASGIPSFSAAVVPPTTQAPPSYQTTQPMQQSEVRRATPQPVQSADDLSEEDVAQLVKDHKELRTSLSRSLAHLIIG
jgi:hypothetical protein